MWISGILFKIVVCGHSNFILCLCGCRELPTLVGDRGRGGARFWDKLSDGTGLEAISMDTQL